jgi:hypothetical protein
VLLESNPRTHNQDGDLSLVSCIIFVMLDEDEADIPSGWRDVVHPRRHGVIAVEPACGSGELAAGRVLAQTAAVLVASCENDLQDDAARHLRSLLAVASVTCRW